MIRNANGENEGMWAIVRDITEKKNAEKKQKNLEDQLHHAQKMESIGRLAGGIAHDFNNLLSIILGYCDIILLTMDKTNAHYQKLEQIYQAGLRASDLTRQLLALSRKQVLEMKVVDLNNIVRGFEKLIHRLIGEDIHLELSLLKEPLMVKADPSQLEQVLMNLAVNAKDAMPDGGTLRIETNLKEIDESYNDKKTTINPGIYALVTISDTGEGIDKSIIDSIFEPFFTTKDIGKGTGLGLATSYGIINQHGGVITVYSELGDGTVFKIFLPLNEDKNSFKISNQVLEPIQKGNATVLILEDDPNVLEMASYILSEQGYTVIESNDPEDAIEKALQFKEKIQLVLSDIIMPKMKGPEAFEKILQSHPEAKVLYMSGYTNNIISREGVLKEGMQFIEKPFTVKQLINKCHEILNG